MFKTLSMLIICFPEDKDKGDLIVKMEIVIADNNDEAGAGRASEIPEPSQPKRKISKNPSEDLSTESPDSGKVQFLYLLTSQNKLSRSPRNDAKPN